MDILEKLFGSLIKVKIIKLFLFNKENVFDVASIADRVKASQNIVRKEIYYLEKIGFVKKKSYFKDVKKQKNRKIVNFKKKTDGWTMDLKFTYINQLEVFLASIPFTHREIIEKISRIGKIQLLLLSGLFIKNEDSRVDMFIVGDNLKQNILDSVVRSIESEIGKEIRYVVFETSEFNYRFSMFDKLIRDILDYPHEKVINKLNI